MLETQQLGDTQRSVNQLGVMRVSCKHMMLPMAMHGHEDGIAGLCCKAVLLLPVRLFCWGSGEGSWG